MEASDTQSNGESVRIGLLIGVVFLSLSGAVIVFYLWTGFDDSWDEYNCIGLVSILGMIGLVGIVGAYEDYVKKKAEEAEREGSFVRERMEDWKFMTIVGIGLLGIATSLILVFQLWTLSLMDSIFSSIGLGVVFLCFFGVAFLLHGLMTGLATDKGDPEHDSED